MDEKTENELQRRQRLRDQNVNAVISLLERRQELRGVAPMADHVADNVGWVV